MDNETVEVLEPEIIPVDENDTSTVANVAIAAAALVGVGSAARFVAKKLPWSITIARKTKDAEVPVDTDAETPAVTE